MNNLEKFEKFDLKNSIKGWVNVKIDKHISRRISKYVIALDTLLEPRDKYDIIKKINLLSQLDNRIADPSIDLRVKLSCIIILQYLREIRENFNASSAGFLLEHFIAALIYAKVPDDYGVSDVNLRNRRYDEEVVHFDAGDLRYQIKLVKKDSSIKVNLGRDISERCDYYIIILKNGMHLETYIFDGKNESSKAYITKYASREHGTRNIIRKDSPNGQEYVRLNTGTIVFKNYSKYYSEINLEKVDDLILRCGVEVKESIESLFDNISELEVQAEAIISGYNVDGTRSSIDKAKEIVDESIKEIQVKLGDLSKSIKE